MPETECAAHRGIKLETTLGLTTPELIRVVQVGDRIRIEQGQGRGRMGIIVEEYIVASGRSLHPSRAHLKYVVIVS